MASIIWHHEHKRSARFKVCFASQATPYYSVSLVWPPMSYFQHVMTISPISHWKVWPYRRPTGRQVCPCRHPAGSQWVVGSGTPIYDNAPIGTRIFFIFPHTLIGVLFQFRTEWCCASARSQIGSVFPGREFKWPSRTMPVGRFN